MSSVRMRTVAGAVGLGLILAACGSQGSEGGSAPAPSTTSTSAVPTTTTTTVAASTTTSPGAVVPPDGYPPDEVLVTCDGTGATLSTDAVLTQPDGIHVTVHNTTDDDDVSLNVEPGGGLVPPGITETVQDLAPATLVVSCGYDLNRTIVPAGTVEVRDPAGNWRPTDIDCTKLPLAQWEEPLGSGATPEEAIRWWPANRPNNLVAPIAPDDEIVLVGYPDAELPRYVSRHEGHDTNIFRLELREDGTWNAVPHENCPR